MIDCGNTFCHYDFFQVGVTSSIKEAKMLVIKLKTNFLLVICLVLTATISTIWAQSLSKLVSVNKSQKLYWPEAESSSSSTHHLYSSNLVQKNLQTPNDDRNYLTSSIDPTLKFDKDAITTNINGKLKHELIASLINPSFY